MSSESILREALENMIAIAAWAGNFSDEEESQFNAARAALAATAAPAERPKPVAWWVPKAEQFCLQSKDGSRPFAKAWEPLFAAPQQERDRNAAIRRATLEDVIHSVERAGEAGMERHLDIIRAIAAASKGETK